MAQQIKDAGLTELLSNTEGAFTVFAPTNTAFFKIPVRRLRPFLEGDKGVSKQVTVYLWIYFGAFFVQILLKVCLRPPPFNTVQ